MICYMPRSAVWIAHLNLRFEEAKRTIGSISSSLAKTEVGLLNAQAKASLHAARIFVPTGINQVDIARSDPGDSLRALLRQPTPGPGWIRRSDLCEEAAQWLHGMYEGYPQSELFCEAGFCQR
jgi:hypothetical protein